jgi:hypothetical protein
MEQAFAVKPGTITMLELCREFLQEANTPEPSLSRLFGAMRERFSAESRSVTEITDCPTCGATLLNGRCPSPSRHG